MMSLSKMREARQNGTLFPLWKIVWRLFWAIPLFLSRALFISMVAIFTLDSYEVKSIWKWIS